MFYLEKCEICGKEIEGEYLFSDKFNDKETFYICNICSNGKINSNI